MAQWKCTWTKKDSIGTLTREETVEAYTETEARNKALSMIPSNQRSEAGKTLKIVKLESSKMKEDRMKSFREMLVEGEMPDIFRVGTKFKAPGADIEITDVFVDANGISEPTTWIQYKFKTNDGKSGTEKNSVANFIKHIVKDKK